MTISSLEIERRTETPACDAEPLLARLRAASGVDAAVALSEELLAHRPPVPPSVAEEAMRQLVEAAHGGHPRAAYLVSLLTAMDPTIDKHWTFALAYLARSAKASYRPAATELAFLAGDAAAAAAIAAGGEMSADGWKKLHDAIDPARWTAPPPARTVSTAPFISVVEGFLSPQLCDWLVVRAGPKLAPAMIYDEADGVGRATGHRTNSEMRFWFPDLDIVTLLLRHRIAALAGHAPLGMEPTAVLHYKAGQEFQPHHDFLNPDVPAFAREVAVTGQRLTTILVYLSDDFDGGETDFPLIGYRFKGRKGDAILFRNLRPDGTPDYDTLHAGLAPTRGEKWLLSQWVRQKPAAEASAPAPQAADTRLILQQAVAFHRAGKLGEAERDYAKILAQEPENFTAQHMLGLLRLQQGRHQEALELIGAALKRSPNSADALSNYGLVLQALKRLPEALACFDRALTIRPDFVHALDNRGTALCGLGRFQEALASFDKALAIDPGNANALHNRARALGYLQSVGPPARDPLTN